MCKPVCRDQVMTAVVEVGGGALPHATANMTYFLHYSQGSGSSCNMPVTDAAGTQALSFDLSEFMLSDDHVPVVEPTGAASALPPAVPFAGHHAEQFSKLCSIPNSGDNSDARIAAVQGRNETTRIAFRTKSEVEILDDGFKWRKYGKKSVKNNSHPRNYYRCSTEGCLVKKRVERDTENPSYVITTYEGIHNHMSPGVVYYTTQDAATGQFYVAGCEMPPSF